MDTFKPTQKMAANAKRGLKLREAFGRGGKEVGVARAHQLADQQDLTAKDIHSMHSYFARHAVDKEAKGHQWDPVRIRLPVSSLGCCGAVATEGTGRRTKPKLSMSRFRRSRRSIPRNRN